MNEKILKFFQTIIFLSVIEHCCIKTEQPVFSIYALYQVCMSGSYNCTFLIF